MTDTASAFLFQEILAEMRAQALQRLSDGRPGHYLPSPKLYEHYRQLMALPRSNSDNDDAAGAAVKAQARSGANDTVAFSQSGTTDATNALAQNNNAGEFIARMEERRLATQVRISAAINATYAVAEAQTGNMADEILAIAAYEVAQVNLNTIANRIDTFVQTATTMSAEDWIKQGPDLSNDFYRKMVSFTQGAFN